MTFAILLMNCSRDKVIITMTTKAQICTAYSLLSGDSLVGLVVKASASRAEDLVFDSRFRDGDFSGSRYTSDVKVGTLEATLPSSWRYRGSAETGRPGVSIL